MSPTQNTATRPLLQPRYTLTRDGREVSLRATDPDEALREALSIAGVVVTCVDSGQAIAGAPCSLTEFMLDRWLTMTPKRVRDFAALPRPITLDLLGYLRLPARTWVDRVEIAGEDMPVARLLAKVLNRDDGRRLHRHEWALRLDDLHRDVLATPP